MVKQKRQAPSGDPLYRAIARDLSQEIESGLYRERPLPTIREMCRRYRVSVITVRQALDVLQARGLIARQRGRSAIAVSGQAGAGARRTVALSLWEGRDPADADYWAPLLMGANGLLQRAGLVSSVVDSGIGATDASSFAQKLKEAGHGGVLLRERFTVPWGRDAVLAALRKQGIPCVLLDGHTGASEHAFVCTDFARAGWVAAEHLWGLGHRRMAFCSCEPSVSLVDDRWRGMRDFMASVNAADAAVWFKGEPEDAAAFLEGRRDIRAAFTVHDQYARLLRHRVCHHRGWRIPEDLALVSCDDSRYADEPDVQLTSMHQQFYQMGAIGAEILLSIMDGRQTTPMPHVLLQPHLVVRRSCGSRGA